MHCGKTKPMHVHQKTISAFDLVVLFSYQKVAKFDLFINLQISQLEKITLLFTVQDTI